MKGAMEEGSKKCEWPKTRTTLIVELKKMGRIAAPMVATTVLQYLLQVVSVMMVGHLNQLSLSSVAIATSLTNVSGFSILSGMAGGLETLCGQAYGAEQFEKFGIYTYTAIISLTMVSAPITIIWIFMDKILILLGQDITVSLEARTYALWLIPALFGSAILKPLTRHVGAAISFSLGTWLNVMILFFFVKYSSVCEKTRVPFSKKAFLGIKEFFGLAIPSAAMVCLKWWACELLVLLAGLFQDPKLETSVLSICLTISTLHFTISYGLGAATSTRVSNELGAGNSKAVRYSVFTATFLAIAEALIITAILFGCRNVLGYAYTHDSEVVHYVAVMTPFICASIFTDSLQAVLSGVARGSGWQHVGAYVNLGAFYLVGVPIGVVLGFIAHFRAKGLWIGIVAGSIVQTIFLSIITALTNWKKQSIMARERIFDATSSDESVTDHMNNA
ncbi:protein DETOXIFICATION [Trifolium repens]|nr:protein DETOXIFICATION [Trifolium repens]